jgi:predicted phosphodiesterase
MGYEKWLVLPDTQWPYIDKQAVKSVLSYAKSQRWDGCLQLGDFMDWDFISRWTKENARRVEGQRFIREYEGANKFLDEIQSAVRARNPKAKIVILEGNHDNRIEQVIDKTPMFEGMIEMEKNLHFKERGILYWKYWTHRKPFQIGKALFIHGEYTNDAHAKKHALNFGKNLFYGHTHDHQLYSKTTMGRTIQAESLGTLSRYDLVYMGRKPSNWSQCFATFYFKPNGTFNHYVTNIFNGEFIAPDGKEYKSNVSTKDTKVSKRMRRSH